ncbi:hypothetical protein [Thermopetrobacter sp. TC1]|uniref:hypothetical protein n=1 Tax=Thermopetrobacter sp. TC1 TaxID=1495045 RepID=UPI00056E64D1|nr:hypothetical protein [Thermopetrobacter sp. TC1]
MVLFLQADLRTMPDEGECAPRVDHETGVFPNAGFQAWMHLTVWRKNAGVAMPAASEKAVTLPDCSCVLHLPPTEKPKM